MTDRSLHDVVKEKLEERALDRAILLSKTKKKMTRDILSYMAGQNVDRNKNDRPDIIRVIPDELTGGVGTLIGIEHFLVEQVSVNKKGKRVSIIKEERNHIEKLFAHNENRSEEEQKLKEIITNAVFDIAVQINKSQICNLKESFCVAFEKHLEKVKEYRQNLDNIAKGKPYKLAFLIEIHCKTEDDFLNNGRTVIRKHNDIYPIFEWMIDEMIRKIDKRYIDYVVLYFQHSMYEDIEDVVAIETKDIRGSLRKQGVISYCYCDDPETISLSKVGITDTGLRYNIELENKKTYLQDIECVIRQAYEYRKKGIPYIAPRSVQEILYACGNKYTSRNLKETIESKEMETFERIITFIRKYPLNNQNE